MMARSFFIFFLFSALLFPFPSLADSQTNKCRSNDLVTQKEGGRFFEDLCQECLDEGNCAIRDMEQVLYNVSNFILAIVGSLVFLMYIIGGIFLLVSRGNPSLITKGYEFFRISTIGLVIVLSAYAGVRTLKTVLQTGELPNSLDAYIICDGTDRTENEACDLNSKCLNGQCLSACDLLPNFSSETLEKKNLCLEVDGEQYNNIKTQEGYQSVQCQVNLCPGSTSNQCCTFSFVKKITEPGQGGQIPQ